MVAAKLVALELHADMAPGSDFVVLEYFRCKADFERHKIWSSKYEVQEEGRSSCKDRHTTI